MSDARRMTEPGNPPHAAPDEPEHWLVRPATIRVLWIVFGVLLVLAALVDLFVTQYRHFVVGGTFGFYVWFGFGSSLLLFVVAKVLGVFLRRRDTYYTESTDGFPDSSPESVPQGGWR